MPNWVYNDVTFTGSEDDLYKLKKLLDMPHLIQLAKGVHQNQVFNFYSVRSPEEDIWDEYNGPQPEYKDFEERIKHPSNHWYDWNIRNWGTKWEASDPDMYYSTLDDDKYKVHEIGYRFATAWSAPDGIMYGLVEVIQKNNLDTIKFQWCYEEEQGWGGIVQYEDDCLTEVESWDIPGCHADYTVRDKEDQCICAFINDEEDWFSDCPRPDKENDEESKETV